jgi:hypothetical protein
MSKGQPEHSYLTRPDWSPLFLSISAALYLGLNLFTFSGIPFFLGSDQTYFWVYAQRMISGELVYRDFFQFTPPGTDLAFFAFFRIFGARFWVTSFVVLLLGIALCLTCYSIARLLMERTPALLTALTFLVWIYGQTLDATHHWFSSLAALWAIRMAMRDRSLLSVCASGLLAGIASCFTQTAGVATAAALILAFVIEGMVGEAPPRRIIRDSLLVIAGFSFVVGLLNLFLIVKVGWKTLWFDEFTYPSRYLPYWFGGWFPGLPGTLQLSRIPRLAPYLAVYFLLPAIYPLALWLCLRRTHASLDRQALRALPLVLLGSFLLLEILPGVNFLRIFCVCMPGIILLVWSITRRGRLPRTASLVICVALLCLAAVQRFWRHHSADRLAILPAGKVMLSPQKYEKFTWLAQHTNPGDYVFQAGWLDIYFPLKLRNPVFPDALLGAKTTRPEFVSRALEGLGHHQPQYLLWSPALDYPDNPKRPWDDHLDPIRNYLHRRYTEVHIFSDGSQVWERQP